MPFKFNIAREDLLKAISDQQSITNKKGTMAILSNVLLEVDNDKVVITGTDLEIGLKQEVPAEVFEKGTLTLPSKKLFELARESSSSTISFEEEENNWVKIEAGSSLYKLAGILSDEFPQFPDYDESKIIEIESDILASLIDKTIFSIAQDKENMFTLTAALLQKNEQNGKNILRMVSSDGHRLSIMEKESDKAEGLQLNPVTLIPRRGINEIRKFTEKSDEILFGIEENQAVLKSDDSLLIIRLMEGEYPDIDNLLSAVSMDNSLKVNRLKFLESLKRINLFTEDMFHVIQLEIKNNELILNSQNADFGSAKDNLEIEYDGEPMTMSFNCRYFIETLQVMEGGLVEASISSESSPCLITSEEDEGFLSIIMPMKT